MENSLGKIIVVADGPTCTGFRLAGIQEIYPREGREAEAKIEELLSTDGTGIVITNEKIMDSMDWRLKKKIEKQAKPVIIAVPDKSGPLAEEADSLKSQIRRALGFEIMQ